MPSCAWSVRHREFLIAAALGGVNADAEVLRLALCKLNPARYGRAEDAMTGSLSSCAQQVLAVDFSELDTKLVIAMKRHKLFGMVYQSMSSMA